MKKKSLKIVVITGAILVSGLLYGYYGFLYKSARDISSEKSAFSVHAHGLAGEYTANMQTADAKYLNQTMEIKGKVTEIRDSLIVLDDIVVCGFDVKPANTDINKDITIKGRCIGFDELFGEVKLDQCMIKQN